MRRLGYQFSLALLPLVLCASSAVAQGGVTYTNSYQVQNLESALATVGVKYYNQNGTVAGSNLYYIPAYSSLTVSSITDVPDHFTGSLVIGASHKTRTIVNVSASGGALSGFAATNAFEIGATTISLPLIMCNNNNFYTWFNVQNVGSSDTSVSVSYVPGSAGRNGSEGPFVIKPGAAKAFSQRAGSQTLNCDTLKDDTGKFIGSATASSASQPIVVTLMQVNSINLPMLLGYSGFLSGSRTVSMPIIMANNSNFYTTYQVQNLSTTPTSVTVRYSANTVVGGRNPDCEEHFSLAAGASKSILQSGTPAGGNGSCADWTAGPYPAVGRYVGGAKATSDDGRDLAVIVNQQRLSPAMGSSHEGFDPIMATDLASAPLIMANNSAYKYYTSIQVQNVDSSQACIDIVYSLNTGGPNQPGSEHSCIDADQTWTVIQNGSGNNGSVNNWDSIGKYIGSATIRGNGKRIVAIINEQSFLLPGDQLATYNAFNY